MDINEIIATHSEEILKIKVKPKDIDLLNKFIEAYDNSAIVTTLDAKDGLLVLWVTADTVKDVRKILKYIPVNVEILEEENDC